MNVLQAIPHAIARHIRAVLLALGLVVVTVATLAILAPIAPAAASPYSIWGGSTPAGVSTYSSRAGVELGTRFTAQTAGTVTSMRFWKTSSQSGSHVGTLWTGSGTKLATARFGSTSSSGWQVARFSKPVKLKAGSSYVVSYFSKSGSYAASKNSTARVGNGLSVTSSGLRTFTSSPRFPKHASAHTRYWVDVVFVRSGAPGSSASPTSGKPTASDTPTPTPTPTPTATPTVKAAAPPVPGGFPNASNTGVPAGTSLSAYTGSCTVSAAGTVIDAKTVNCAQLVIRAKNVVISRSLINGTVYTDTDAGLGSFTISDSQVNVGAKAGTGIGDGNFTAVRVHVTGGNRSINCFLNCTVTSSYVHGQFKDNTGVYHESGIRMGSGSVIRGNTIACDAPDVAPDAGCSAALTGYGDFAIVQNDTIDGNLFIAGSGGYCSYGGSTPGKPYSSGVNNMRFTNNVWQRGGSGKCGVWGPITSFDPSAPGNVWANNTWSDGSSVSSAD